MFTISSILLPFSCFPSNTHQSKSKMQDSPFIELGSFPAFKHLAQNLRLKMGSIWGSVHNATLRCCFYVKCIYVSVCFCYVWQFALYFMFYVLFYVMFLLCLAVCSLFYVLWRCVFCYVSVMLVSLLSIFVLCFMVCSMLRFCYILQFALYFMFLVSLYVLFPVCFTVCFLFDVLCFVYVTVLLKF